MRGVKFNGKYLPRDRRDLQQRMVDNAIANMFTVCVKLKLFQDESVDGEALVALAVNLFKLVKRRHTHLWNKVDRHVGAGTVKEES